MPSPIFIGLHGSLDWSKVHVERPVENKNANGNSWYTSKVYFKDENGEKRSLYFELAEQAIWGIGGVWPMGTSLDDQILDTVDGYQIAYPLTSRNSVDTPTPTEIATQKIFDNIRDKTSNSLYKFCEEEKERKKNKKGGSAIVPSATYGQYLQADEPKDAVKPIYNFSTKKDPVTGKSKVDESIPKKAYIKLKYYKKKEGDMYPKCVTQIKGPGNKPVSVIKYLQTSDQKDKNTRGTIKSVMLWEDIYWGPHGSSTYGCSSRVKLVEIHYNPQVEKDAVGFSFLGPNNTPLEEEEEEDDYQSPKPTSKTDEDNDKHLQALLSDVDNIEITEDLDPEQESTPKLVKKVVKKKKIVSKK